MKLMNQNGGDAQGQGIKRVSTPVYQVNRNFQPF